MFDSWVQDENSIVLRSVTSSLLVKNVLRNIMFHSVKTQLKHYCYNGTCETTLRKILTDQFSLPLKLSPVFSLRWPKYQILILINFNFLKIEFSHFAFSRSGFVIEMKEKLFCFQKVLSKKSLKISQYLMYFKATSCNWPIFFKRHRNVILLYIEELYLNNIWTYL